jgi:formylglycine-generating enzyme required for sulfatase activity
LNSAKKKYGKPEEIVYYIFLDIYRSLEQKLHTDWRCDESVLKRNFKSYNYPVAYIIRNDANAYCRWLAQKTGKNFRLPLDAEWKYPARGGNKSLGFKYSGSN